MGIKQNNPGCNCCDTCASDTSNCLVDGVSTPTYINQVSVTITGAPSTIYGGQTEDEFAQLNGVTSAIAGTYVTLLEDSEFGCIFPGETGTIDTSGMTASMISVNACLGVPFSTRTVDSITGSYTFSYTKALNGLSIVFSFFLTIDGDGDSPYGISVTYRPSGGSAICDGGNLEMEINLEPYIVGGSTFSCTGYENASNTASSYEFSP